MSKPQKLVRDNIPAIIESQGNKTITRTLSHSEYHEQLERKLQEEVAEFLHARNIEELADILEVVYALAAIRNVSPEQIEKIRKKKAATNGAFKDRIFLEEIAD
ncbi:MAG TPA: nucleoside triphosphate pyrophosphohydrolase [Candidatus Limnocylindrales bacterium]|nr:nucleoside triphosphate pyrophosphohydrolase [Candidatus Limnocylindrales bacterium]